MNKARNNELIKLANEKLKNSKMLNGDNIAETYDGKTAALSVSVAMSGLLPTLAIYFQDFDKKYPETPCRRDVLNVVASMINDPRSGNKFPDSEGLFKYAIADGADLSYLQREVVDCAVALKQVVRTYNLV